MKSESRKLAGASLVVMGAGFAVLLPFQDKLGLKLLAGGFEAGLVGGLADWFAVTALFRHPLGIPIPHTALLPRNRKKLTEALVGMVQNNLLHKDSIVDKLKGFRAAERILDLAQTGMSGDNFRNRAKSLVLSWLDKPADGIWALLRTPAAAYVRSRDWAEMILSAAGKNEESSLKIMEQLFDYALHKGTHWLVTEDARREMGRMAIQAISNLPMNGLMQFAVNTALNYFDEDQIGGAIQQALVVKLRELGTTGHPTREAVLGYLEQEWNRLRESEETRAAWNKEVQTLLGAWVEGEEPRRVIRKLQQLLSGKIREGALLEEHLYPLLERGLARLRQNGPAMDAINGMIQDLTVKLLEANHSRIGALVRENLDKMDNASLISLVEDKAGKDLQWIRVNGAVCGFVLGLIFSSVRMLF